MNKIIDKIRHYKSILNTISIDTPIGKMIIIADNKCLMLLQFEDSIKIDYQIKQILLLNKSYLVDGKNDVIVDVIQQLKLYFKGQLKHFSIKTHLAHGTPFQKIVWKELLNQKYGQTISYAQLAARVDKPQSFRAVANANGANPICLIVPCHRIISSDGSLGGYSGGLIRKKWLLDHENQF